MFCSREESTAPSKRQTVSHMGGYPRANYESHSKQRTRATTPKGKPWRRTAQTAVVKLNRNISTAGRRPCEFARGYERRTAYSHVCIVISSHQPPQILHGRPRILSQNGLFRHPNCQPWLALDGNLNGHWMEPGSTLDGPWMDAGWTLHGAWTDIGWTLGGP